MSTTVHVKNISHQTSEKEVRDFFSFCGKIKSLSVTPTSDGSNSSKSATVTFEKETAAKTALLLDHTQLGPSQVSVTSATSLDQMAGSTSAGSSDETSRDEHDVAQEDKPRSRILAEYLAHGYVISDKAIERALGLDKQHGLSTRFTQALQNFDSKYKATDRAHAVDAKYGVSDKAEATWRGLTSYFDRAMETPTGQKLRQFYMQGNKQVVDVHNEARHLADLKSGKKASSSTENTEAAASSGLHNVQGTNRTQCNCHADTGKCSCAPGACACSGCAKNPEVPRTADPEKQGMYKVAGTDRTQCNCGGNDGQCPCEPGTCVCGGCAKNPEASGAGVKQQSGILGDGGSF